MLQRLFLILGFLIAAHTLPAQEVVLKAALDRDSIMIGEQAHWILKATVDKSLAMAFPKIDSINGGLVEILYAKADTLQETKNSITIEATWTITSFDAAIYPLPAIPFLVQHANGKIDTLYSEQQLELKVKTVAVDTTSFEAFDIKTPITYPITLGEVLPWAGGGLLLLALIAFIIYYIRNRKKNQPLFFKPKPQDPPYVTALRELEKIKGEKLWQNNKVKIYYTRISDVLRTYLEEQHGIQAMEQTSEEILLSMQTLDISSELMDKLKELFNVSDLVKFAKYQPEQNENENAINIICDFVYKTRPTEETIR